MCCEHMGDVHDVLDEITSTLEAPRLNGDFIDGWTESDWATARFGLETP